MKEPSSYLSSFALLGVKIKAKARSGGNIILEKYSQRITPPQGLIRRISDGNLTPNSNCQLILKGS